MLSYEFYLKTEKKEIDFINKIFEAYEGLGVVRTLNPNEGLIKVVSTMDFVNDVREIINDLDEKRGVPLKIIKEGIWEGVL